MLVAPIIPTQGPVRCRHEPRRICRNGADHIVQRHDDVGPNVLLVLHGILWSQQQHFAWLIGIFKGYPIFGYTRELGEGYHLKTSRVGQEIVGSPTLCY